MDAADLKFFAAVAKAGGMNRAAGELNTVQSNVTARVRTLEEELGVAPHAILLRLGGRASSAVEASRVAQLGYLSTR